MILIADSGSTKTDWVLVNSTTKKTTVFNTKGLNPAVFSERDLHKVITANTELMLHSATVTDIYFYGAGCGTETSRNVITTLLKTLFKHAKIVVKEDIYAAVYATSATKAGIICILGTGSNCCYFDGKNKIQSKIPSLGYLLMDDASGNYFGKQLLRDFFYYKMPKKLHDKFKHKFNLYPDDVKQHLYKKGLPNTYLAQFASFLITHKKESYCKDIIDKGFSDFIENQITQYDNVYDLPIHFVGSIAFLLQDELKKALKSHRLNAGQFIQKPIDALVAYHLKESI